MKQHWYGMHQVYSASFSTETCQQIQPPDGPASKTPAVAGQVFVKGDGNGAVVPNTAKFYRSATATCMFMMQIVMAGYF